MDLYQKISILGPSAAYDTCGPKDFAKTTEIPGVYKAKVGSGVCRLFKVLQSNVCRNNCNYCAFRRDRSCQRVSATPEEMAKAFNLAYSRRLVQGFFLSSAVFGDSESTMTRMLETAKIVRQNYRYSGYLHLKIMPGVSAGCIREAAKLANRISLNIESPTESGLTSLSPDKNLKKDFFVTLSLIKKELARARFAGLKAPSVTTQFVVGAGSESDREIINTSHFLYKNFFMKRIFYSAFRPVENTPFEKRPAASLTREHRLYQADFLMRFYRFFPTDIPLDQDGFLTEANDPKTIWAKSHPEFFPINLGLADYWTLLRVPGIGPVTARKIIKIRGKEKIKSLSNLKGFRLQIEKISPYVYL